MKEVLLVIAKVFGIETMIKVGKARVFITCLFINNFDIVYATMAYDRWKTDMASELWKAYPEIAAKIKHLL